ncbi:MAG: PHP domain-containing protein, partial [Ignavibacterium sp.]
SYYTLLCGTSSIDDLLNRALEYKLNSLALTDNNGMYGLIEFYKKAKELNIKPILGSLITDANSKNGYAIFLAKNIEGYKDLCSIITAKKLDEKFNLSDALKKFYPNLIIITPDIYLLNIIHPKNTFFAEIIFTKKRLNKSKLLLEYVKQKNINVVASNPIYFLSKED